ITKIQRIERFITGYDNTGDANILIFDDQSDFNTDDLTFLSPYNIMRSGLHNTNFVDNAMLYLYLKNKFNKKKPSYFQKKAEILDYNQDEQTRFSNSKNDFFSNNVDYSVLDSFLQIFGYAFSEENISEAIEQLRNGKETNENDGVIAKFKDW
ncbi:3578_t:CDS:2, partial [Racocetra fulgida]